MKNIALTLLAASREESSIHKLSQWCSLTPPQAAGNALAGFKIYLIILTVFLIDGLKCNAFSPSESYSDSTLIENSLAHPFSDPLTDDTFSVKITGRSLIEGEVLFTIINNIGKIIYSARFPARNLLGYAYDMDKGTLGEKELHIEKKIVNFFSEENFIYPAIKDDEKFDQDYSNKETWDDIRSDNQSIGFCYWISSGYYRKIAYSKKKQTTVVYFKCC